MNQILGINNASYFDTLLSTKIFSFKINKLSTTYNMFNGRPSDILYTGHLNKDISFGGIVYRLRAKIYSILKASKWSNWPI